MGETAIYSKCVSEFRQEILVGGFHKIGVNYRAEHWRQALTNYLERIWSGDPGILKSPKIYFSTFRKDEERGVRWNHVVLELDAESAIYWSYYLADPPENFEIPTDLNTEEFIKVGHSQPDVEWGLARFMKDNKIRLLTVTFPKGVTLHLIKEFDDNIAAVGNMPHRNEI